MSIEWSVVSKAEDRSRRQRQETCWCEMALDRWSCRESVVVGMLKAQGNISVCDYCSNRCLVDVCEAHLVRSR